MSLISIKFQFIELIMIIRASPKCGDARFGFSLGSSCTCINLPLNGEILWSDLIQSHGKAYRLKTP